ncbi:alpha/beta hydrolase [Nonomuraea roseola]|uniref:Alpha/beta hydrolase n=1 Tax=Nonomuraea roseola TaxID=46179 RepID=A0ABV5PT41_9ACTN
MADHTAALGAYGRAAALAAEHHTHLDTAMRLMRSHAWVGGGAPAFTAALARHRAGLQSSLTVALTTLAHLVVRQGGPAPALPALTTSVTTMSATPGTFQGIDPLAMSALTSALEHAGQALSAAGTRLAAELSAHGLPAEPGHTLGRIADWSTTHSADLRRRLTRIQQTVPGTSLPAGLAAHDLFAAHATDPAAAQALLARVAGGDGDAVTRLLDLQDRGEDPGLAARVHAWWHTLTQGSREQLIRLPGLGLLNGLPASVRDRSNRLGLAGQKAALKRRLDAAAAELDRLDDPTLFGGWERLANQLRRIENIERELQPVPGHPPPLLLAFDVNGQGRLIVSWGDPDTADTTVTSVSGLTSGLDAAPGDLQRSRALWQQATKTSGKQVVASITWLGYDAPQIDPGLLDPDKSVAFERAAAKGGAALAAFADGLRAAHVPSGTARAVVVGHSYGSLTTGHAAVLRPGRLADEFIFVGSPGVGVDHASQLGVRPHNVWVGEAGNDPVAALGRFGADPGNSSFGAKHFPVGRDVYTSAHSSYWNQDSVSLRNMGRIINGQRDELDHPAPLNERPQLLMPELAPDLAFKPNR